MKTKAEQDAINAKMSAEYKKYSTRMETEEEHGKSNTVLFDLMRELIAEQKTTNEHLKKMVVLSARLPK